jgi:hypothetical protein
MKDTDSAFPLSDGVHVALGMTLRQYAAIHLKVPCSGDAKLDAAILESRRADLRERVFSELVHFGGIIMQCDRESHAKNACVMADALLAEMEKEVENEG